MNLANKIYNLEITKRLLPQTYLSIIRLLKEENERLLREQEYLELSKILNVTIKTKNQYELAMKGATKEIIEKDEIPSYLY